MFAAAALTLGADGLTARKHINSVRQVIPSSHDISDLQMARRSS
jgi:hypothetical protein